jgi:hypothetical protein
MKRKNAFFATLIAIVFYSCGSATYYQVYNTKSSDKLTIEGKSLLYEDENCRVSYNFWGDGGNIGFNFYNKTDQNIYIKLDECFFVLNGISRNYFKNRVFTSSASSGESTSHGTALAKSSTGFNYMNFIQTNNLSLSSSNNIMNSSGYSISYYEEKTICIPSMSSKIISEYVINQLLFRDCDLYLYPSRKLIKSISFEKSDSPLVFSNRIIYSVGLSGNQIKFENEFFVTGITNYPESEITGTKNEDYCGEKSTTMTKYFTINSPDKFYIKYSLGQDSRKH